MRYFALLLLASGTLQFEITDPRGKRASGVTVEAGEPDVDGWRELRLTKAKPGMVIVWPYDRRVKEPDGTAATPVLVAQLTDSSLRSNARAAAAALLRGDFVRDFDAAGFATSSDSF